MKALRSLLAAVLATAALSASATDKTDLWWNPSESGWGMTIANQGDTIFVAMYVYGSDNQPMWFVGTASLQSTDSQGVNTYVGDWYRVTGPYYGAATFDPSAVGAVKVGTYTYRELTVTTGQIVYTVNGTSVTKNVQRQTLQVNPRLNGNYSGAYFSTTSGCTNQAQNGNASSFINASISGTPSATQVSILFGSTGTLCTLSGPYTQAGRMGALTGTWSCSTSFSGTASFVEIEAGTNALSARFNTHYNTIGCTEIGYLGIARIPPPPQ